MFKLPQNCLISHAGKVMLKILQAWLQQYMNRELPDVQAAFIKAEEPEIKLPASIRSMKMQERVPGKYLLLLYWLCQSLWRCGSQKTVEILKKMGIPDHLTWEIGQSCLLELDMEQQIGSK